MWGGCSPSASYADSLAYSSYACRVSVSWSSRTAKVIFVDLRLVSPLVWCTLGMVTVGRMDWVWGFWKMPMYALPSMLLWCGLNWMWMICWCWDPAIAMVVGIRIFIGVSMVASIAYA